jgi:hypothetical protein
MTTTESESPQDNLTLPVGRVGDAFLVNGFRIEDKAAFDDRLCHLLLAEPLLQGGRAARLARFLGDWVSAPAPARQLFDAVEFRGNGMHPAFIEIRSLAGAYAPVCWAPRGGTLGETKEVTHPVNAVGERETAWVIQLGFDERREIWTIDGSNFAFTETAFESEPLYALMPVIQTRILDKRYHEALAGIVVMERSMRKRGASPSGRLPLTIVFDGTSVSVSSTQKDWQWKGGVSDCVERFYQAFPRFRARTATADVTLDASKPVDKIDLSFDITDKGTFASRYPAKEPRHRYNAIDLVVVDRVSVFASGDKGAPSLWVSVGRTSTHYILNDTYVPLSCFDGMVPVKEALAKAVPHLRPQAQTAVMCALEHEERRVKDGLARRIVSALRIDFAWVYLYAPALQEGSNWVGSAVPPPSMIHVDLAAGVAVVPTTSDVERVEVEAQVKKLKDQATLKDTLTVKRVPAATEHAGICITVRERRIAHKRVMVLGGKDEIDVDAFREDPFKVLATVTIPVGDYAPHLRRFDVRPEQAELYGIGGVLAWMLNTRERCEGDIYLQGRKILLTANSPSVNAPKIMGITEWVAYLSEAQVVWAANRVQGPGTAVEDLPRLVVRLKLEPAVELTEQQRAREVQPEARPRLKLYPGEKPDPWNPELRAALIEHLARGRSIRFAPVGKSMAPLLQEGDEVIIHPLSDAPLRGAGDIVLCTVEDKVLLHRILFVEVPASGPPPLYHIANAAGRENGAIPVEQIHGRCVLIDVTNRRPDASP